MRALEVKNKYFSRLNPVYDVRIVNGTYEFTLHICSNNNNQKFIFQSEKFKLENN